MRSNFRKNIAQKGGLMIEALAMLGLIAVVTPTMYKKSAERTLEVEDINTADTVRSYMGAAESYMASNYRNLIKEMTEDAHGAPLESPATIKKLSWNDIKQYMPYGFENDKSLYDYNAPKIAIFRQGSNLTAFALFPAKSEGGVGQERTSRIASLIGANGGYTKVNKSAHGVGGVWNLSASEVENLFDTSPKEFSLVTASSNVVNSTSGAGAVENTKYLQRTSENTNEKWRNSMRTDLYMGGYVEGDRTDPNSDNQTFHNIRNINSLIVGAERDIEDANNGLYIAPTWTDVNGGEHENTNINAYIAGTLTAAKDQFFADENKLYFGKTEVTNGGNTETIHAFDADVSGNISSQGSMDMGQGFTKENSTGHIYLGSLDNGRRKINNETDDHNHRDTNAKYFLQGDATKTGASLSLLSPDIFQMTSDNTEIANNVTNVSGTHLMIEKTGYKGISQGLGEGYDSLGNLIGPRYINNQIFPVVIGSNALVKGILSAGQVDVQTLRTATFSTGSDAIDSDYKWLAVDKKGIEIRDIDSTSSDGGAKVTTGMYGKIDKEKLEFRSGTDTADAGIVMQRKEISDGVNVTGHSGDVTVSGYNTAMVAKTDEGTATVRNDNMGMQVKDRDLTIGVKGDDNFITADNDDMSSNPYRVIVGSGGNVDMIGSNLKIMDSNENNILSIKGNSNQEDGSDFDTAYNDFNSFAGADDINYNITSHGNVLFSSMGEKKSSEIGGDTVDDTVHFMAVGPNDNKAGVTIAEGAKDAGKSVLNNNEQRLVFVDLSTENKKAYVDGASGMDGSSLELTTDSKDAVTGLRDQIDDHKINDRGTMKSGMVYVRRGMVEVVPDRTDVGSSTTPSVLGANDGNGIVRASRFVANNINKNGTVEKVPALVKSTHIDSYNKYSNEDVIVPYDTYMVNPAYTSVMKDIKLTTRGGARLSDILPDFIAKGIYLASNTFDDSKQVMEFTLDSGGLFKLTDEPAETATSSASGYTINNWASPYSGLVPAPQCPPGYGRVVTINPYRFEMAQAGQLALSADAGYTTGGSNGAGYYVNTSEMTGTLTRSSYSDATKEALQNELIQKTPDVRVLNIGLSDSGGSVRANVTGAGFKDSSDGAVSGGAVKQANGSINGGLVNLLQVSGLEATTTYTQYSTNTTGTQGSAGDSGSTHSSVKTSYILSTGEGGMRPLVFQQSTWFHSEAVPVVPDDTTYIGYDTSDHYVRGWAILQGFLYHQSEYANFACPDGTHCKELSPITGKDENEVLWNLFPVAKNSIGSYVNTYCYFDRANLFGNYNDNYSNNLDFIDKNNILSEVPSDYKKGVTGNSANDATRKAYYEQLNDPTMKYNEVW